MYPVDVSLEPDRLAVVLVRPEHEGNVGAAARALGNLGIADLRLVAGVAIGAPARWMACAAGDLLDRARRCASLGEATADCALAVGFASPARPRRLPLVPLPDLAPRIAHTTAAGGRVALVFGNEATGLSHDEASQCSALATIPLMPAQPTLNLAQAVLLAGYELLREPLHAVAMATPASVTPASATPAAATPASTTPTAPRLGRDRLATAAERAAALAMLDSVLAALDYGRGRDDDVSARIHRRLRAVLERAGLEAADVRMLRGLATRLRRRLPARGSETAT